MEHSQKVSKGESQARRVQAHDQMQRDWWALHAIPLTFTAGDIATVTIFLQVSVDSSQL